MSNSNSAAVIEGLQEQAAVIARGEHPTIKPGQPVHLSDVLSVGDGVAQGDLCLLVLAEVPKEGFKKLTGHADKVFQLVQGNTQGARHCIEDVSTVELFIPDNWNFESLMGPVFRTVAPTRVLHPVHGTVSVDAGIVVQAIYQRVWAQEAAKERRNRD